MKVVADNNGLARWRAAELAHRVRLAVISHHNTK